MLDKTFAFFEAAKFHFERTYDSEVAFSQLHEEAMQEVKLLRAMPEIVLLAGSARFKVAFEQVAERMALDGKIVFGKHIFKPGDEWNLPERNRDMIHAVQFRMVDLASRLHIINVDGYIGQDTYNLIRYALRVERTITFHEDRVRLLVKEGATVTPHHFLQATRRRVEFEEATTS